jgi:glycine/D-amino acid oxidase-like deaminating enzyme
VYPALRGVPVAYDWTGPIDCVPEHVPVFDQLAACPNILYGMGYNGTGIAQTPIGGRILASLALERDDNWSRSGLVGIARRKALPPEPFRFAGAKLVGAAVRRKNSAELVNETPDPVTRAIVRLMPGASEH